MKKFKTYLSRRHHSHGLSVACAILGLVLAFSSLYWTRDGKLSTLLAAQGQKVFVEGEYWRLWTSVFIHADMEHLLSNSFFLILFGYFVYSYFGFTAFPLVCFLAAGVANYFSLLTYPSSTILLGASGLVYIMGGFWHTLYVFIQRPLPLTQRLFRSVAVWGVLFFPTSISPRVSYRTHFIGLLVGIVLGCIYFWWNREKILAEEVIFPDLPEESTIEGCENGGIEVLTEDIHAPELKQEQKQRPKEAVSLNIS